MGHFLGVALGFPMVIFTALLGLSLVYWLFVLFGFAHASFDGADGVADGALDGAADGLDVGGHDVGGHDVGGHDAGDLDGDLDADAGHAGMLSGLKLRSAPITVVASCVLFFSWIFGMFGATALEGLHLEGGALLGAKAAILLVAPMLALFPTSLVVRPLGRTLKPVQATKRVALVGKLCTIRTGTVTERFGEATLEDGGAGLVVRVRVESGEKLGRGDQAVIVGYDDDTQEFTVAPLPDIDAR
jgi:hypothetical protein